MFYNHINAQIIFTFFGQSGAKRVVCNINPLTKASCNIPGAWSICTFADRHNNSN